MRADILNVFCGSDGSFGNPVGLVDSVVADPEIRQAIATGLGFSETVFVLEPSVGRIAIHNPQEEISFSGHAAVGAAWHFANHRYSLPLQSRDGLVQAWTEGDMTWVRTRLSTTPPWVHEKLELEDLKTVSPADVSDDEHAMYWAWSNEAAGEVRARTFAPAWGIPEDEANGSGSMQLAAFLDRELRVMHGVGSVIHARHDSRGVGSVGGLVQIAGSRDVTPFARTTPHV